MGIIATAAYGDHTYHLLDTDGTKWWAEAEAEAQSLGGHLVTINDAAENRWVFETFAPLAEAYASANDLPDQGRMSLWIGLTDLQKEGSWVWASGEPVSYTNWYPGQPQPGGPGQDYAGILGNFLGPGRWHDINTGRVPGLDLPFGVVEVPETGTKTYMAPLYPDGITWDAAKAAAEALGGHLATITSQAENDLVASLVDDDPRFAQYTWWNYYEPWLGGYQVDKAHEPAGGWAWVTGEPFTYTNWAPGEPNDVLGQEDKLHLHLRWLHYSQGQRTHTWNDIDGANPVVGPIKGFFAEFDARDVTGTAGTDVIRVAAGAARIDAGAGDDRVMGGPGDDTLGGGAGSDWIDYRFAAAGVTVDLGAGTATGAGVRDLLAGFENAIGSNQGDLLVGDAGGNRLDGGAGQDSLSGGAGEDELAGAAAGDALAGGPGDDRLLGGKGGDLLSGGAGQDRFEGGVGADRASYAEDPSAVVVDLSAGTATDGWGDADMLTGVENALGSAHDDDIRGDDGWNVLKGLAGADRLSGGAGSDRMLGGSGKDLLDGGEQDDRLIGDGGVDRMLGGMGSDHLTGGGGGDKFMFRSPFESGAGAGSRDVIGDFSQAAGDRIVLQAIDADATIGGNQDFAFVGADAFTAAGQLRFVQDAAGDRTIVEGNVNADLAPDFQIELVGVHQLTAGDFVL